MSVGVGWTVSRLMSICLVSGLNVRDHVQLMSNLFTFFYINGEVVRLRQSISNQLFAYKLFLFSLGCGGLQQRET